MEHHLPIPTLYRLTNNHFIPSVDTLWVSDCGNNIIKVTKVLSKENLIVIFYKTMNAKSIFHNIELSVSTHKFHSMFSSFDIV